MQEAKWLIIRGYVKLSLAFLALHLNQPVIALVLFMFSLHNFIKAIVR